MTGFPDSTAAPEIHELSGSSKPGAAPRYNPKHAPRPRPQVRPRLDAEDDIIALAERAVALARREDAAWLRRSQIDDHLERIGPKHPTRAAAMGAGMVLEYPLSTLRENLKRHEALPDIEEWLDDTRASIAVMERYEQAWAAMERRYGVPRLQKRIRRMHRRLMRWGVRLTAMEPTTLKGLAAKAALSVEIDSINVEEPWATALGSSVSRDAVRIASLPTRAQSLVKDDELVRLQYEWNASGVRCQTLSRATSAAQKRMQPPPVPDALRFRAATDASCIGAYQNRSRSRPHGYTDPAQIDQLRRIGAPMHQARRDEIVSAFDAWKAAIRALEEASGFTAAEAAWTAEIDRHNEIERQIARTPAVGRDGLAVKIDVAIWGFQNDDGVVTDDEIVEEIEYRISKGVDEQSGALPYSVLLDLKRMLRPVDINVGLLDPVAPVATRAA